MQSFLIAGTDNLKAQELAKNICSKRSIDPIDVTLAESEKAFGIEDLRNIQKNIFFKPIKSREKAVIINLFKGVSLEAQNSMLKLLEEPPNNTIIILLAEKTGSILPTILSRCEVIEIKEDEVLEEVGDSLEEILTSGTGARLLFAQNLSREKQDAINFVKSAIFYVRDKMNKESEEGQKQNLNLIKELEKAYYYLKETNVSPRMTLENLFLNLP